MNGFIIFLVLTIVLQSVTAKEVERVGMNILTLDEDKLSSFYYVANYNTHTLFIENNYLYDIERSVDYVYYAVFTIKSEIVKTDILFSEMTFVEDKSWFHFSENDVKRCLGFDVEKDYGYKETQIKDFCEKANEIAYYFKNRTPKIEAIEDGKLVSIAPTSSIDVYKLSKEEFEYKTKYSSNCYPMPLEGLYCYKKDNSGISSAIFNDNMISTGFEEKMKSSSFQIKDLKLKYQNKEDYTLVTIPDYDKDVSFTCLDKDCSFICEISDIENNEKWCNMYENPCYKRMNQKSVYNELIQSVEDNYKEILEIAKIKQSISNTYSGKNVNVNMKEIKSEGKGYYYEDFVESYKDEKEISYPGYYKGYFINNKMFIYIEQKTGNILSDQSDVYEVKIVKSLNDANSFTLSSIDDLDKGESGIEKQNKRNGFMSINDSITYGQDISEYFTEYVGNTYTINDDKVTIQHEGKDNVEIQLKEIDSSLLQQILSQITKDTKPLPDSDSKCLVNDYNLSKDNKILKGSDIKYQNTWYSNTIYNSSKNNVNGYMFFGIEDNSIVDKSRFYSYPNEKAFSYYTYDGFEDKYLKSSLFSYFHSFVELNGEEYSTCNIEMKNKSLSELKKSVEDFKEYLKKYDEDGDDDVNISPTTTLEDDSSSGSVLPTDVTSTQEDDSIEYSISTFIVILTLSILLG